MNNNLENIEKISNEDLVTELAILLKLLGVNLNMSPDFRIEKRKNLC